MLRITLAVLLVLVLTPAARAQGYLCAEGGGSIGRGDWVHPAFAWMVDKARPLAERENAGLRVVILGSRDDGQPLEPVADEPGEAPDRTADRFRELGAAEVKALWVNSTNAHDEEVAEAVRAAHIIWMRGGSQSRYCKYWAKTPIEAGIRAVFARGGVVGGTSAGCAVLGEVAYDAYGGSCGATDALRDAHAKEISFTTGFLDLAPSVIFDTHFTERARIARLAVYLARIRAELGRDVLGIGMDARAALCVSPDGSAEVLGTGAACIMHLTAESKTAIPRGAPPAVTDIAVTQIVAGQRINLRELAARLVAPGTIAPRPVEDRAAPVANELDPRVNTFARGDATDHMRHGLYVLDTSAPRNALSQGTLTWADGQNGLGGGGAVIATRCLTETDRRENAAGGVLWVLTNTNARWGALLEMGGAVRQDPDDVVRAYFPYGKLGGPMAAAVFVKTEAFKPGPKPPTARQAAAFEGMRMHILAPGWGFDLASTRGVAPAASASPDDVKP